MKANQSYTPKYWMCHNRNTDDVLVDTAAKSRDGSIRRYIQKYGKHPYDDGFDCDLVQIKIVNGM